VAAFGHRDGCPLDPNDGIPYVEEASYEATDVLIGNDGCAGVDSANRFHTRSGDGDCNRPEGLRKAVLELRALPTRLSLLLEHETRQESAALPRLPVVQIGMPRLKWMRR
jgi:hypothetical protein